MIKELLKGSVIYGIAPFIPKILSILLLPIMTRYLTSADYGIIGTITSIVLAVQALQDLGLRVVLTNYFYKCRCQYKIIWREVYGFLSLWMIVYAIIQSVLLFIFMPAEAEENKWLIILLSNFSTVFFGPTSLIGQTYYQLNIKPEPVAIRLVLSGFVTIIANFLCVVVFRWGYMGAYVGSFAGTFVMNVSYWPVLRYKIQLSPIYLFKWKTIKGLLKVSIPTTPHYYASYLMNSTNVVAMNYYGKSKNEIGSLTMAQNFTVMFESFINAINQVFSPMEYQYVRDGKKHDLKRLLYTYILITYALTFFYSIWSREFYYLLIKNEEIATTYRYSIVLVMALNYRPLYAYCVNYFFYYENTVKMLIITFMAGIISCVTYFLFMPSCGINAALWGFYLGCIYLGYSGYMYKFYKSVSICKIKWPLFLLMQLILTIISFAIVELDVLHKIITTVLFAVSFILFFFNINKRSLNNEND